jgi:hypothetical protein
MKILEMLVHSSSAVLVGINGDLNVRLTEHFIDLFKGCLFGVIVIPIGVAKLSPFT